MQDREQERRQSGSGHPVNFSHWFFAEFEMSLNLVGTIPPWLSKPSPDPHFVIPAEAGIHITIINRTRNGIPRGSPGQAQGPVPTRRIGVGTIPP